MKFQDSGLYTIKQNNAPGSNENEQKTGGRFQLRASNFPSVHHRFGNWFSWILIIK
jgi:hypothetical protein